MSRPSRNVDALLLRAGRELYPETGAAGLSIRKVAERAGVNLGMFHYHFRTKEAFVRQLLQALAGWTLRLRPPARIARVG